MTSLTSMKNILEYYAQKNTIITRPNTNMEEPFPQYWITLRIPHLPPQLETLFLLCQTGLRLHMCTTLLAQS